MKTAHGILAGLTLLASQLALADIVANPVSIVDHGGYISDTVHHLDWYKFSNSVSTVNFGYANVIAPGSVFSADGWSVASLSMVHGLWQQYGYLADTPSALTTPNAGLTKAMIDDLGTTLIEGSSMSYILAFTSEGSLSNHSYTYQLVGDSYHDYVNSALTQSASPASFPGMGVWLARESSDTIPVVPEPSGTLLFGAGLLALWLVRRRV